MTTVAEAAGLIEEHISIWPDEHVPIEEATGRVITEDIVAERDIPAFDRVTMDGIAIAWQAWRDGLRRYTVAAIQGAGVPPETLSSETDCIQVMTGAVLPHGTDTVVPIERLSITGDVATIEAEATIERDQFVHHRGSDRSSGSIVLPSGCIAGPPELAVLASVGQARVRVSRLPRIAVISTGDELVEVDAPVAPHQIRSSNDRAIEAAVRKHHCGLVTRRRLRDEPDNLLSELESLHAAHDVLILSGGVSMGEFDFVPGALEQLGAQLVFHRIAQKPGRPMWFGMSRDQKPIFALPGNPVSTLVCMARYVIPALRKALGAEINAEYAELTETMKGGPNKFTWFVPVRVSTNENGRLLADASHINTSGDFSSLAATDGIAELGTTESNRRRGAVVQVFRW